MQIESLMTALPSTHTVLQDFLGVDLAVGDYVVMRHPGRTGLIIGKISEFTAQRVKVAHAAVRSWPKRSEISQSTVAGHSCVKVDAVCALAQILSRH
jgi:hypothetical protein